MKISELFLELTKKTYPFGYEDELAIFLPSDIQKDTDGNYFYKIGDSKTIFTCHLDTASKIQVDVNRIVDRNIIKTDNKTILGADDKAGMTVLLNMIENKVPGLYYFFIGEEVGCVGSGNASQRVDFFNAYDRIVSFDRRGTQSIITYQSGKRTCSDVFGNALKMELAKSGLKMQLDKNGIYTDSAEFSSVISECTNISVGYNKEHTNFETQDINFLERLSNAVLDVNWESLPTKRDQSVIEYDNWNYKINTNNYFLDTSGYSEEYISSKRNKRKKHKVKGIYKENLRFGHYDAQPDFYYVDGKKTSYNKKTKSVPSYQSDYYGLLRPMYLTNDLSKEELDIIKKDFLGDNKSDKAFADYLDLNF